MPIEAHLQKTVGTFNGAWLRYRNEESDFSEEEKIHDVERDTGPNIQEDEIRLNLANPIQEARFLKILEICRRQKIVGATNQAQIGDTGVDDDIFNLVHPMMEEICQREVGRRNPKGRVEVRPSKVGIDDDHLLTSPSQADSQGYL